MKLVDLVDALMNYNIIEARQWVADAMRSQIRWSDVPCPIGMNGKEIAVSAGVVEMLAQRMNQEPPSWVKDVGGSPVIIYLVRSAKRMPRLRTLCELEGPEPLRKRKIFAPPEFLTIA